MQALADVHQKISSRERSGMGMKNLFGKNKWLKWVIVVVLILIVSILVKTHKHVENAAKPIASKAVSFEVVKMENRQPTLSYTGTIEAVQEAIVAAQDSGIVDSVMVQNGSMVDSGQTLVQLDSSDYKIALESSQAAVSKAQAELAIDQANLEPALTDYNRDKQLFSAGAVSEKGLDDDKNAVAVDEAEVDSAQSDLAAADASVTSAQNSLNDASICSPISGLVSDCNVKVGQYLSPGMAPANQLLRVEDISSVYADVDISEDDAASVKTGMIADVSTDNSTVPLKGAVEQMDPVADSSSRMFETKILIPNGEQLLKPGMFVKVQIDAGAPVEAVSVPLNAVISQYGLFDVFVDDGGKAKSTQVQVGQVFGQSVEIESGLQVGQKVILTDVSTLKDGDLITLSNQ
jgi:RND family efflux transporter MFP subunit